MFRYPILLLLLCPIPGFSQTAIRGVINSYYRVTEVIPNKSCVRVDNAAGLGSNALVMLVQMKGAQVNSTNTASFGSLVATAGAGSYEINSVCRVKSDSVYLSFQMLQAYSAADKLQLVLIPQYYSAQVTDTLKPLPWDSATGKGGVLALSVLTDLVLQAPIYATGMGYKGGAYLTSNNTCSNLTAPASYFYNPGTLAPQDGAYKGESVADLGQVYRGGKGALANGGGGGNNHNNGGGGGSNLGAGGPGGGNASTSACTVSNPGKGGYALNSNGGYKLFLGGGGGAGHANSGQPSSGGGRGGGIIFLRAATLYSNGFSISAGGVKGGSTTSDGASGGGGGGSIVLDVNSYADVLSADASGGAGGNESDDNTSGKCYGEGGGGGGGALYLRTALPAGTATVSGGAKGLKQFFLNCGTLTPATAGTDGSIITGYSYVQSFTASPTCQILLPVPDFSFSAQYRSGKVLLQWHSVAPEVQSFAVLRRREGGDWEDLFTVPALPTQQQYTMRDEAPYSGLSFYRLRLTDLNGRQSESGVEAVRAPEQPVRLGLYPNPATAGWCTLVYTGEEERTVRIYDALGRLCLVRSLSSATAVHRLDISSLRKGSYLVSLGRQHTVLLVP